MPNAECEKAGTDKVGRDSDVVEFIENQDWVRGKRAMSGPDSPRGTERFLSAFRSTGKHRSIRR